MKKNPHVTIKTNKNVFGVLNSVQQLHMSTTNTREKNKYLSLVAPHFSSQFLRSRGFKFCSSSFVSAREKKIFQKRYFVPPSKQPITRTQKRKIHDFLFQHSTIASNKIKKIKLRNYFGHFQGKKKLYFLIFYLFINLLIY